MKCNESVFIEAFVRLVLSNLKRNIQIAEIGVWQGETTIHYLPMVKANNGHVFLVDWFYGNPNIQSNSIHEFAADDSEADIIENNLKSNISTLNCEDIVTIYRDTTQKAALLIEDNSLDICFIDADHHYQGVKQDILTYMPKVKKGGILCGHDCENLEFANTFTDDELLKDYIGKNGVGCHPGVIQAVYDIFVANNKHIDIWLDNGAHRIPVWSYIKE